MTKTSRQQIGKPFKSTSAIAAELGLTPVEARILARGLGVRKRHGRLAWTPAAYLQLAAVVGDVDVASAWKPADDEE
jgi:hypothetical protein